MQTDNTLKIQEIAKRCCGKELSGYPHDFPVANADGLWVDVDYSVHVSAFRVSCGRNAKLANGTCLWICRDCAHREGLIW